MQRLAALFAVLSALLLGGLAISQNPDPVTLRAEAKKLQAEGNFKDALDRYEKLLLIPNQSGPEPARDLAAAMVSLARLGLQSNADKLLLSSIKANPENWRLLFAASTQLNQLPHHGIVQGKSFLRNPNGANTGVYVDRTEEDRQQSLQWLKQAFPLIEKVPANAEVAQFYLQLANTILIMRSDRFAWKLQELTDLESAIDYADLEAIQGTPSRFASVDEKGDPVLFQAPSSWVTAKSDGERLRWALQQSQEMNENVGLNAQMVWGRFLNSQFSVDTLQDNPWLFRGQAASSDVQSKEAGVYAIHTLSDQETIAKLASGIKRFTLQDEFNPIAVFRELAKSSQKGIGEPALATLAEIHLNRRQFTKGAEELQESIRRFGDQGASKQRQLDSILQPRGAFDPVPTQLAGKPASLSVVFRNAKTATFEAHQVDLEKMIADTKAFYQTATTGGSTQFGGIPNTAPPSFEFPGNLFTDKELGKYATKRVANWDVKLEPRENHWDRRIDIETPLSKPGLYVVTAKWDEQHLARCLVWIQDTAFLRKPLDQKQLYWLADAAEGNSLGGLNVEFFGIQYSQSQTRGAKQFNVRNFAKKSDAQGRVILGPNELQNDYQWFAIARDGKGRIATLGIEWIGLQTMQSEQFDQLKAYGVSDRPAYRPGDTIHAKLWLARATYSPEIQSVPLANEKFTVRVIEPQGSSLFEKQIATDKFGGIELEVPTTKKAMLGPYSVQVMKADGNWIESPLRFRIEEYRKPEFEVKVVAPDKPVALGETIRATVRAKYYFGSPVTDATATIRVNRTAFVDNYYPVAPFDWCFGSGYWWHAYDYSWYPGWERWAGCRRPAPWWIGFQPGEPPELVLEQEIKLDASGEAKIEIDTAVAKALQATQDHRYTITVEVRDASRRTIDAEGQVIAARNPFKIYSWLDRGFYRVGDKAVASFHARTPGGEPVAAKGKLELRRVQYNEKRDPIEKVVQTWEVETKEDGRLDHPFQTNASGQFRLRLLLTDVAGHEMEGGYIFTVRGDRDRGADFRFNAIELITDRQHYQPNDKVALQINVDHEGAQVLLFVRPQGGVYPEPQFIKLEGKSKTIEIPVTAADQPNFFIEASTVFDGEVHTAVREVLVPPEKRILNVKAKSGKEEYLPGEEATIDIEVTDALGKPTAASTVIAVYDRSIDAIAGDVLPGDIREFFWKWRRNHYGQSIDNLQWQTFAIGIKGVFPWNPLGIFGDTLADDAEEVTKLNKPGLTQLKRKSGRPGMAGNYGGLGAPRGGGMERSFSLGLGGFGGGMPAAAMMDAAGAPMANGMVTEGMAAGKAALSSPQSSAVVPTIRKEFADTALWVGQIETDASGRATKKFKLPENVTSWKMRTWAMGDKVRVGSDSIEATTRKNLLVRLQAPRFLVERDQCVISSIVNNDFPQAVDVRVRLEIDGETQFKLAPNEMVEKTIRIESHEQKRVDWKCIAIAEGEITLRTIASSSVESDAMQIKLPILVNGILKTDSFAGTVRPGSASSTVNIKIPEARRVEQSRLIVRMSPSLAASMVDALPYLAEYPHGCTEQTLNRFLPTVITQKVLLDLRVDLEKIAKRRNNLNAQELGVPADRSKQWKRFERNPVFDPSEVNDMVEAGLRRLTEMQCSDGGWGWFSGIGEHSYPHTTAVVVRGLKVAQQNDLALVPGVLERGIEWLVQYQNGQLIELKNAESKTVPYKPQPDNLDALIFHILSDCGRPDIEMQNMLYEKRQSLSVYGLSLLALGTHQSGNAEQTAMLRRNIEQFLVEDGENETAFLRNTSPWWYWYGSEIEGTAAYLKLLTKVEPKGRIAARVVKHLLNNRKHATYWASTRDTAFVIESFADFIRASGETSGNVTAEVYLDGARLGSVAFTPDNLFDVDNTIAISGNAVPVGEHKLEVRRSGEGPIYWNVYSTNFTLEEEIAPAGLEVKVLRKYYLLTPVKKDLSLAGDRGQVLDVERAGFERTELADLTEVKSGATVEVELTIESKNDYEYLLLEDAKPATLEPIELQSGYSFHGGLGVFREFRDQRVSFFLRTLPQGTHSLRYRLRAEAPGTFTALPSVISGMYAPELIGNSADFDFRTIE